MTGKQLRLFLADGSAGGLTTAEIMNWTGHVVTASRSDVSQLLAREEAHRTGVYVLIGESVDAPGGVAIYVGEGDDIGVRLRMHARPEDQGGKDFWDRVAIVSSKDANVTKAHARYLESRLISIARSAARSEVKNSTSPPLIQLPEADGSDMEYFLSQVLIVFPVLGITAFRIPRLTRLGDDAVEEAAESESESPTFVFKVPAHEITAKARQVDGEFVVVAGSRARNQWVGTESHPGYKGLHRKLIEDGGLSIEGKVAVFTRDVVFASPSAAAAVVAGRSANGRTSWIEDSTGRSFGEWESRPSVASPMNTSL